VSQTSVETKPAGHGLRAPDFGVWQVPRLNRDDRIISGTASGIAREVGVAPLYVRISFVVLTITGGWGVLLYFVARFTMARQSTDEAYEPIAKGPTRQVRNLAFAMIVGGLLVLSASNVGGQYLGGLVWPAVFIGAALTVALDRSQLDRFRHLGDVENQAGATRLALGLALLFGGVISATFVSLSFWQAVGGLVVAGLVMVGAGIVFAPIIRSQATDLLSERRLRIRSEEKAEISAHLHDSVLQTLTLIQKRSQDASVVSLARRQERELRTWLFDEKALNPNLGFRAGLEAAMASVEDTYQLPVELVVVGDCATDADVAALLQASREAATNAAKHAGAPRIDVFAEVGHETIEVFVRDQGVGFDADMIDDDRVGVRDSIRGRMERHGGAATLHSTVGKGTEVELVLPRRDPTDPSEVETF